MGTKRKKKDIAIKHIISNIYIHKHSNCSNCPIKLYNDESKTIIYGVGNIFTDTIFVLPTYDVNAKIGYETLLTLLQKQYKELTNKEVLEDCYITRVIKCFKKTNFDLERSAVKFCIYNLLYEIIRIKPKKVIFLTKDYNDIIGFLNQYFTTNYYQTYNIGVLYYNNEYKDEFIKQLKEII